MKKQQDQPEYRIFDQMNHGVCIIEKIADSDRENSDYRYLYVNAAFKELFGLVNVNGRIIYEVVPDVEQDVIDFYDQVLISGKAEQFEQYVSSLDRWIAVEVYPSGTAGQLAVIFNDVSEKRRAELELQQSLERQSFLLKMNDELRNLAEPGRIKRVASVLLGEKLRVERAAYAELLPDDAHMLAEDGYLAAGVTSVAGTYHSADFGAFFKDLTQGQTAVIEDSADGISSDAWKMTWGSINTRAAIAYPIIKSGKFVAALYVHSSETRYWTPHEVALVAAVGEQIWDAVERERLEEILQKSETRFRSFVAASSDLVYRMSPDWQEMYTLIGKDFLRDTLYPDRNWVDTYIPEVERERVSKAISLAIREKRMFDLEHQVLRADGGIGWTHSRAVPLMDKAGEITEWLGAATDITLRKLAQEQLQSFNQRLEEQVSDRTAELLENQLLLRTIIDSSFAHIQVFHAIRGGDGRISDFSWLLVNKRFSDAYGDMTGKSLLTENPAVVSTGVFAEMVKVVETGKPILQENYYQHEQFDGWFHQVIVKMDGGVIMTTNDITDRKQAELELELERNRLRSVFNTTLIQLSILRAIRTEQGQIEDLEIMLVNNELEKETGRNDLVGKRYLQEYPGIKVVGLFDMIVKTIDTGVPQQLEYYYPHEGFNKWFACVFVKMEDGVVATNMDITSRKNAEQERLKNYVLLQQSENMALLGSWDYDLQTGVFTWSDGMYRLFELEKGTPVQPEIYEQYATEASQAAATRLIRYMREGNADFDETLELWVGGRLKLIYLKGNVVRDVSGQALQVLGVDMDITAMRGAEEKIRKMEAEQQLEIVRTTLSTLEEERRRISESLHNGLGQIMYGIKISLNVLSKAQSWADFDKTKRDTDKLLTDAIKESRRISHELLPVILEQFGLKAAIDDICEQLQDGIKFTCKYKAVVIRLEKYLELAVYRTVQELMMNVVKHAEATLSTVDVNIAKNKIYLRVEDNGNGIKDEAEKDKSGIGLTSIRSKVNLLNGTLKIYGAVPRGTIVEVTLPVPRL